MFSTTLNTRLHTSRAGVALPSQNRRTAARIPAESTWSALRPPASPLLCAQRQTPFYRHIAYRAAPRSSCWPFSIGASTPAAVAHESRWLTRPLQP